MKVLLYRAGEKEKMIGHKNQIHVGKFEIIDVIKDDNEFRKLLGGNEINIQEIEIFAKDFYLISVKKNNEGIVSVFDEKNNIAIRGDIILVGSYGDVMVDLTADGITRINHSFKVMQFNYETKDGEHVLLYNQCIAANLQPID